MSALPRDELHTDDGEVGHADESLTGTKPERGLAQPKPTQEHGSDAAIARVKSRSYARGTTRTHT